MWIARDERPRLCQVRVLMEALVAFGAMTESGRALEPILLCGDFNSTPDTLLYRLLVGQAEISTSSDDTAQDDTKDDTKDEIHHHLRPLNHFRHWKDAYRELAPAVPAVPAPIFTNYTANFKGCLDYILYKNKDVDDDDDDPTCNHDENDTNGNAGNADPTEDMSLVRWSWSQLSLTPTTVDMGLTTTTATKTPTKTPINTPKPHTHHLTMEPTSVLALPHDSELRAEVALPSSRHPSDHVPLRATFQTTIV